MSKNTKDLIIAMAVAIIIGLALGWILSRTGTKATITWKYGDSEQLQIDLKRDLISPEKFLEKIFSKTFSSDGVIGWLAREKNIFHYEDGRLASLIETLPVHHDLSDKLQEMQLRRRGPFAYETERIEFGVQKDVEYAPMQGEANCCENGKYRGKTIRLANPYTNRVINVFARKTYPCPGDIKTPDLQLCTEDAEELLAGTPAGVYNEALATIIPERPVQ